MGLSPTFAIGDAVQPDELYAHHRICKNGVESIIRHHNYKAEELVVPPLPRGLWWPRGPPGALGVLLLAMHHPLNDKEQIQTIFLLG